MPILRLEDTVQAKVYCHKSLGQMKYQAVITVDDTRVIELLRPEIERFKSLRSGIKVSRKADKAVIEIEAADATALRASTDSVVQLLKVFEKMSESR
jgi:tRNA threonylcarbamoyladenosine modification (KEOPS) complex  Pcc1 subunit